MKFLHIQSQGDFDRLALETFRFQAKENAVYGKWVNLLGIDPGRINQVDEIPFLPVEFFKSHDILTGNRSVERIFESSGTTGITPARHLLTDTAVYDASLLAGFRHFFGNPSDYAILALLPSYLERGNSSLVYMMEQLITLSGRKLSGFYLHELDRLAEVIRLLESAQQPSLLVGVTYALLDLAQKHPMPLSSVRIIETGGMKGKRPEMNRQSLHSILQAAFSSPGIMSEYGMTELLSQAWSLEKGIFMTPPWMQIRIRDPYQPFQRLPHGRTGGIDIIDLANLNSCAFIQTQDLGRSHPGGSFEVLGRFSEADLRGCNLLVS